ncbi:MAG TPA: hypothetical protein VG346_03975 [Acidimicrobiales bacterium]|nr:hypothetical protein [Acidimicrobiales bacterium]
MTASPASPSSSSQHLFDVEPFRTERRRAVMVRQVAHPTLVLGSTQAPALVAPQELRARGVELVRRRGGGGAVYLEPGNHLWLDAWIPRDDPLWSPDVSVAAEWVGRWWVEALGDLGVGPGEFSIHAGRALPGRLGDLVCFAGRGPGEVFERDRKVVGLSQWRSREGALFSSCAYHSWEPGPLLELLEVDAGSASGEELASDLTGAAIGLGALLPSAVDLSSVRARLVGSFPEFATGAGGA